MKYLIIIEKANNNYSAYIPDVPGCIATGKTPEIVKREILKALEMHLKGMVEDGLEIPQPMALADYVGV